MLTFAHKNTFSMKHRNYRNNGHQVQIVLFRNEIMYDTDFQSNRVARLRFTDEELKKSRLASTESTASDSKEDYIDRCIHNALSVIRQKLRFAIPTCTATPMACDSIPQPHMAHPQPSLAEHHHHPCSQPFLAEPSELHQPFTAHEYTQEATNAISSGDMAFAIVFNFEEGWHGIPQNVCDFAHEYIVNSVLADWFTLALPDLASVFTAKASAALKSLVHEGRSVILPGSSGFFR